MKCKILTVTAKLQIKNGRYYAIFKRTSEVSKTKYIWRTLELEAKPGNKRKALVRMERQRRKLQGILEVEGYDVFFMDYIRKWKESKEHEVEENTYQSLSAVVEKNIAAYFEPLNLRLSEVASKHIHGFYEHLYKNGRRDGKEGGLSITSIKKVKSILNEAFKRAIVDELIIINPVESVKLPTKDNPRKPHTVLNQESANRLLGAAFGDELMYPLLLTTLRYGLRMSETLGLKWKAIDFENKTLRVESVIVSGKHKEKSKTKTKSSNASFPLLPDIVEALKIRKEAQERNRELFGNCYTETEYVFTHEDGRFLNSSYVRKRFYELLEESGLPHMRFHDLRHSTACILYDKGMGILELQQWMRHSKLEMTADLYLHIQKEREKKMADGLANLFSRTPESNRDFIAKRIG